MPSSSPGLSATWSKSSLFLGARGLVHPAGLYTGRRAGQNRNHHTLKSFQSTNVIMRKCIFVDIVVHICHCLKLTKNLKNRESKYLSQNCIFFKWLYNYCMLLAVSMQDRILVEKKKIPYILNETLAKISPSIYQAKPIVIHILHKHTQSRLSFPNSSPTNKAISLADGKYRRYHTWVGETGPRGLAIWSPDCNHTPKLQNTDTTVLVTLKTMSGSTPSLIPWPCYFLILGFPY